ncbi:aminotransferase class V-fold PLP-dependent enzyme [Rhodococcus corynebacterioides]|uniref:Kynureninase n=1 Tax=Rhodococcoides corynebacterioides TaxID=53972 RepID=A0ABS7P2F1_9NOCA|nr:aminotransferase class V-fold PLP-dependent enzyme [Rhodococcus corynebacterioides]MBY6366580.1 aminotransferase class V-fold PLP-dependent enzyme [Rhodococcus corynebacterioides]MBY6408051.1 aminotransferase class V-fold PLP-dependent enzyme [Rhodococcus corynebacterioides]
MTRATEADATDPLRPYRDRFHTDSTDPVVSYLDGNSLGRPTAASIDRVTRFLADAWGGRLIRGWDEQWWDLPITQGDTVGRVVLGAAAGQTVVADSTTVLLYKLIRGALALRPGRTEIVVDRDNFPTDRYVVESIAQDRGLTVRWIDSDPRGGVETEHLAAAVTDRTAVVVLSHVAYRSGFLLDAAAAAETAHARGALLLLDLSHSVGSVPLHLDEWGVDLATGCTYKYLNGGPGSPAFAYVRREHHDGFDHPIHGWAGRADSFAMEQGYVPADGVRRVLSGTPPILAMIAMQDTLQMIDEVGMEAVRRKSVALTALALEYARDELRPLGVEIASPEDPSRRGGHVTLDHPGFRDITPRLWSRGVVPDFRAPRGLRLGPSPLSTSFLELVTGMEATRDEVVRYRRENGK